MQHDSQGSSSGMIPGHLSRVVTCLIALWCAGCAAATPISVPEGADHWLILPGRTATVAVDKDLTLSVYQGVPGALAWRSMAPARPAALVAVKGKEKPVTLPLGAAGERLSADYTDGEHHGQRITLRKFPDADRLFFTDEALQQASSRAVAQYRAQYFRAYDRVADLGCGIGADTLALAEVVPDVFAVERDPVRARLAAANVAARGLCNRVHVICADWTRVPVKVNAAFVDPARRINSRRVYRLNEMEPPISAVLALLGQVPNLAVKVAPGVDHEEIPPPAEVEFISERRTLKEALLLFGDFRSGAERRATLLPGAYQLDSTNPASEVQAREPGAFLYEPDAAVLRAALVRTLATRIRADQIDPRIAYLTSDTLQRTRFARVWRVVRHGAFRLKTLNRWLRDLRAGDVVVKKRGSPIDPDTFRRRLKTTPDGPTVTVFLTRSRDRPWMVVGTEITP